MAEHLRLQMGDGEFEAKPENTRLYTFLGTVALNGVEIEAERLNHLFFEKETREDNTVQGGYMFRVPENADTWDTIAQHLVDNNYPLALNQRHIPQCDIDAYEAMLDQYAAAEEIPDTLEGLL